MENSAAFQSQFIAAINELAAKKKLAAKDITEILSESIKKALMKEDPLIKIDVDINLEKGALNIFHLLKIVKDDSDDFDDINEIFLSDAIKTNPKATVDDYYRKEISLLDRNGISKSMVQYILQLFKQRLAELSNKTIAQEWSPRIGEVIFAEVEKNDEHNGSYIINLETTSGYLQRSETIKGEVLHPGKKYWFVIKNVKEQSRGWPILLSRSDGGLLNHLLKTNIPEVQDGTIEVKAIARLAGLKSKVAVISHKQGFDPVGAIIGQGGEKIKSISSQIRNEMIDVLIWNEDPKQIVVNAIAPVEVVGINIVEDSEREKSMEVIVEDQYLPNVIGRAGINVKLLAQLTGWNIDIKSISQAKEEQISYEPLKLSPEGITNNNRRSRFTKRQQQSNISNNSDQRNWSRPSVSFTTKIADANEIVVDLEVPNKPKENKQHEKRDVENNLNTKTVDVDNNSSFTDQVDLTANPLNETDLNLENQSNETVPTEIVNQYQSSQKEMNELIDNIDLAAAPKRAVKELKLQSSDSNKKKDKDNKSKKKSQRKVLSDFALLDETNSNESQESDLVSNENNEGNEA